MSRSPRPRPVIFVNVSPQDRMRWIVIAMLFLAGVGAFGMILVRQSSVVTTEASGRSVQTAFASTTDAEALSVTFPHALAAGDFLIIVASNRTASAAPSLPGWQVAFSDTERPLGQAVFYKLAGQGEPRQVDVAGYGSRTDIALQAFEFAGVDAGRVVAAASVQGEGNDVTTPPIATPDGSTPFLFSTVTASRPFQPNAPWGGGFVSEGMDRTYGGGSMLVASASKLAEAAETSMASIRLPKPASWSALQLAFERRTISSAQGSDARVASADASLSMTTDTAVARQGDTVTSVLTLAAGPTAVTNVVVRMHVPKPLRFSSASATAGMYAPDIGEWRIPALAAGASAMLTVQGFVDPDALAGSTTILQAAITEMEERDANPDNDAAYGSVTFKRASAAVSCPTLGDATVALAGGAETVSTSDIQISAAAAGATYALVSENPDSYRAPAFAPGTIPFKLSDGAGEKTVYVWLGNACRRSFVIQEKIQYVPVQTKTTP